MDMDAALKDGYTVQEINQEAAKRTGFNYAAALADGYDDDEINKELRKRLGSSKTASLGSAKDLATDTAIDLYNNFKQEGAGVGAAAVDMLYSIPKAATAGIASIGARTYGALTGQNDVDLGQIFKASMEDVEKKAPGLGHMLKLDDTKTYSGAMKLVEPLAKLPGQLGEGAKALTGSGDIGGAAEIGASIFGVPGVHSVMKGMARFDPTLRNVKYTVPESLGQAQEAPVSKADAAIELLKKEKAAQESAKQPITDTLPQQDLFAEHGGTEAMDIDSQGLTSKLDDGVISSQYNASGLKPQHLVIDENGMPINAGRSMEVENIQNPTQRGLWGDELSRQHPQEYPQSMSQLMDTNPSAEQFTRLRSSSEPSVELQAAIKEANAQSAASGNYDTSTMSRSMKIDLAPAINYEKAPETQRIQKTLKGVLPEFVVEANTPEDVVAMASKEKDVSERMLLGGKWDEASPTLFTRASKAGGALINQHTKGLLFENLRSNNTLLKYTQKLWSDTADAVTVETRRLIDQKVAPAIRKLSNPELIEVYKALQGSMKEQLFLTPEVMKQVGFNKNQIEAATALYEAKKADLAAFNRGRVALGKKPVDAYTGYMIGMSDGNFRRVIYRDKPGPEGITKQEVLGVVGSDYRHITDRRVAELLKNNPEWKMSAEKYNGKHSDTNPQTALQEAFAMIMDNNPENFGEFSKAMEDVLKNETVHSMGAAKHAKGKKGVFGMEGDKSWESDAQNAKDFINANIRGTQLMTKWGAYAETSAKLNKVFSDPTIQESQKNAIATAKDYSARAMGKNTSTLGNAIDNALIGTVGEIVGVGPNVVRKAGAGARTLVNTLLFLGKPSFYLANNAQPYLSTPAIKSWMKSRGIEVSIDPTGWTDILNHGLTSILLKNLPKDIIPASWKTQDAFETRMWEYGAKHGMSDAQIIIGSPHTRKDLGYVKAQYLDKLGGFIGEGIPRAAAYTTMSNMLRKAGYENDPHIFEVARHLTDLVMVDYRHIEQAKLHNNFGMLGGFMRNLTTFSLHQKGVGAALLREGVRTGNFTPFGVMLISVAVSAGVKGLLGYSEADEIVQAVSKGMGKPTTLDKVVFDYADKVNKDHPKLGDVFATGAAAFAGVDMSNTLGMGGMLPGMSGGGGALVDIAKDVYNVVPGFAGWDIKMLAKDAGGAPAKMVMNHLKMLQQTNPETGQILSLNRKGEAPETLNQDDINAGKLAMTGINKAKQSAQTYNRTFVDSYNEKKQKNIIEKIQKEQANTHGNVSLDYLKEQGMEYIAHEGTPAAYVEAVKQTNKNLNVDALHRYLLQNSSGSLSGAYKLKRTSEK